MCTLEESKILPKNILSFIEPFSNETKRAAIEFYKSGKNSFSDEELFDAIKWATSNKIEDLLK